jgi:nitric oxide reductase NorD protein
MSHRTDGRSIAVLLLLDLSASLNDEVPGTGQTVLELSQEAVSLLAWAIDRLGDPLPLPASTPTPGTRCATSTSRAFPSAGTTRSRPAWRPCRRATPRAWAPRCAMPATTWGTPRPTRSILLLLTDGEPADIDVTDAAYLRADARKAVEELAAKGVTTFCLSLDPKADDYVSEIFGKRWRVLDRIERLPEQLPWLYLNLTR